MTNLSPTRSPPHVPLLQSFFRTYVRRTVVLFGASMALLNEPLHIFRDDSSPHNGGGHNQALDTFLSPLSHEEQGSVVVMKTSGTQNPVYIDMAYSDLIHVREYFLYESPVSGATHIFTLVSNQKITDSAEHLPHRRRRTFGAHRIVATVSHELVSTVT